MNKTMLDPDFIKSMQDAKSIVYMHLKDANEKEDLKQVRYLRGILRGMEMTIEVYELCVKSMIDAEKRDTYDEIPQRHIMPSLDQ
jgi:hypothetical protein